MIRSRARIGRMEEILADEEREAFGEDMKLARRIMRDNRRALRALADAPPADDEPL
jgi:hypothetical protein